jgi:sigma-B regulation protein RsbU (phosphoserine phosphatase)
MSDTASVSLRILSLEDSDTDEELILRELKRGEIDFVSRRVETREDFLRETEEFKPELILADYKLPLFNGAEALALARERCPDVPVIMISGAVGEDTAVELLKNGATDFVLKDRLTRLVPAVRRALREVAERLALRIAEEKLRALNEALEQRVTDRTRELRQKNLRMEEDLSMAKELQLALLPHRFPTLPRGVQQAASAVKFSSIFHPASSVSGDFFNVVRVSETAVGVFICDVMGHGVRAALVTAMMRALEEQLGELASDPGALLTAINHSLCGILRQSGITLFTTACYIVADIGKSRISVANAAHPSPLLMRHHPREIVQLTPESTAGSALGLFEDEVFRTYSFPVAAADLVLLFTDGLFEVENALSECFGEYRLRNAFEQRAGLPPAQLVHEVLAEIEQFAAGHVFLDDVCLVSMEIARLQTPVALPAEGAGVAAPAGCLGLAAG